MSRRKIATALAVAIVSMAVTLADAGPADYVMPVEKHTTPKGKPSPPSTGLSSFSSPITSTTACPTSRSATVSGSSVYRRSRPTIAYAAVWVRAEQAPDPTFAALPIERQASAMFSRYAVPMLSRLAALPGLESDPDVYGFSVAVEWVKPGSDPNRPTMEILAMFADKASTKAFLGKKLPSAEYVQGMKLKFFDGDKEVGRIPIEIWDDNFVGTYKVPGYELEKGKVCS